MKKFLLIFFICMISIGYSFTNKAHQTTTNYMHAYQDMYIRTTDGLALTVNIGGLVIITADESDNWGVVAGLDQLASSKVIHDVGYNVKYVLRDDKSFEQGVQYIITVNLGGAISTKNVTFNMQYVIRSVTIDVAEKYRNSVVGDDWFKGGLKNTDYDDANLSITGMVTYRYETEVFPSQNKPVYIELYISDDIQSNKSSVGADGIFVLNNFSIPVVDGLKPYVSVDIEDLSDLLLYKPGSITRFKIAIDNQAPLETTETSLNFKADNTDKDGDGVFPEPGYFDQAIVTFSLRGTMGDSGKSGLSTNMWVLDPKIDDVLNPFENGWLTDRATSFNVDFETETGIIKQGRKEVIVYIIDNVFNYATRSIFVTIDVDAPQDFAVIISEDTDNNGDQITPNIGWYNDETVSFNWSVPYDAIGLKSSPYQFKSEAGWVSWSALFNNDVNNDVISGNYQSLLEGWVTVDAGGDVLRKVYVRAADRAGNVVVAYASIKVDNIEPTVNIVLEDDGSFIDGAPIYIKPKTGWYHDFDVEWNMSGVQDDAQLHDKPIRYRYLYGNSNTTTTAWLINEGRKEVSSDERPTGNIFLLQARDQAGNIGEATANVYVDTTAPVPTSFDMLFEADTTDANEDGVFPEIGWYDQTTINLMLTWDSCIEDGGIWKTGLYLHGPVFVSSQLVVSGNQDYGELELFREPPEDVQQVKFLALLVDNAGNMAQLTQKWVYVDLTKPENFLVTLAQDSDSGDDGLDPAGVWYDDNTIEFDCDLSPQADTSLKAAPYQFRVNQGEWQSATINGSVANFLVSDNASSAVEVRLMDMAGNVTTRSISVTVDSVVPSGSFVLNLAEDDSNDGFTQLTPDAGWYNQNLVSFKFNSSFGIVDTFNIREYGYFLKREIDQVYVNGKSDSKNAMIYLENEGATEKTIVGAISDMAGNVIEASTKVFVDTDAPVAEFEIRIENDTTDDGDDGYYPEEGWHDQPLININWDQASDGAGRLHDLPFRVKSDSTVWSNFQYQQTYSGLYVRPSNDITQSVYIQVKDKAGNLATHSATLKVDTKDPVVELFLSPQIKLVGLIYNVLHASYGVNFPLAGWFNTENVLLTWNVETTDESFPSRSFRVKVSADQLDYGDSISSNLREIFIFATANNHEEIMFSIVAWDKAGNASEATASAKVDTMLPTVTVDMESNTGLSLMPFVNSQDILTITLEISEAISVTPFITYARSENSLERITINSFHGLGDEWVCTLDINTVEDYGPHTIDVFLIDDAGNICVEQAGYSRFIKLSPGEVNPPEEFVVKDVYTGSQFVCQQEIVSVSFTLGTSIKHFLITEKNISSADAEATVGWEDVDGITEYNDFHTLDNENDADKNKLKTLYLWVADASRRPANNAVIATINRDAIAPRIKIHPNKTNSGSDEYDNQRLSKTEYTAEMTITHNIAFLSGDYVERAQITPSWELGIFLANNYITGAVLSPYLAPKAESQTSPGFMTIWWASYNLQTLLKDRTAATYNAVFNVTVKDQAGNTTNNIYQGESFEINTLVPLTPTISVYALDGRTGYTNSLNIICVISKNENSDQESNNYAYYKIYDDYYGAPRRSELEQDDTIWPKDGDEKQVVSFSVVYKLTHEEQGEKDILIWVANNDPQTCINPAELTIIYDSIAPTYEIVIEPIDAADELTVTLFFNERIDVDTRNVLFIESKNGDNYNVIASASLTYVSIEDDLYLYSCTFNADETDDIRGTSNRLVSINVYDLAGNYMEDRTPFSRILNILTYGDYYDRALYNNDLDFQFHNIGIGASDIPVIYAELKAAGRNIHLSGVNLKIKNADINILDRVHLFADTNQTGLYDEGDNELANAVFTDTENMKIPFDEILVNKQTTTTIFVVIDAGQSVNEGREIGFGFITSNPFDVEAYEVISASAQIPDDGIIATFNMSKTLYNIAYLGKDADAVSLTRDVNCGSSFVIKKFALRAFLADSAGSESGLGEGVLWESLRIGLEADFPNEGIVNVSVYKNNNNNVFDDGDLLISSGQDKFLNDEQKTITINFSNPVSIGGNDPSFFLVAELDRSVPDGETEFSFEIASADWFKFIDDDYMIDTGEFPVKTITFDADYYISQITVEVLPNPERYVVEGEQYNLFKLKLNLDYVAYEYGVAKPKLKWIDIERDSGILEFEADLLVLNLRLYRYLASQADDDFSLGSEIAGGSSYSYPNNRIRISYGEAIPLATENYFSIMLPVQGSVGDGTYGTIKTLMVNYETAQDYIDFGGYGTIVNEQIVTSTEIEIIDDLLPTKPEITGNSYLASHKNIGFYYSTKVAPLGASGVESIFVDIGTGLAGRDIYSQALTVSVVESKDIQEEPVVVTIDGGNYLNDDTDYFLSVRAKAGGGDYYSVTGSFVFHTDFTPPWTSGQLDVIPRWEDKRHDIVWTAFTEAESYVDYYIVEMLEGSSLVWKQLDIVNAQSRLSAMNPTAQYNVPYQYRVKAVNASGLSSLYKDSGDRIMTTNTTEIMFNVSNYPNPFYSAYQITRIVYSLNQDVDTTITIYDSLGHFVVRFDGNDITKEGAVDGTGFFCYVDWDGRNASGQFVSKGGYFAVLEAAPFAGGQSNKVVRMIGVIH